MAKETGEAHQRLSRLLVSASRKHCCNDQSGQEAAERAAPNKQLNIALEKRYYFGR